MHGLVAGIIVFAAAAVAGGASLCPEPLHIRREIHDPIAETNTVIDEYCHGNRIVTVRGARVAIADYGRGELTEIDRAASTFSITPLSDVSQPERVKVEPRAIGLKRASDGRMLDTYELHRRSGSETTTTEIIVDRSIALSAPALEALAGAAVAPLGFPIEQSVTYDFGGEAITFRSKVISIDRERASADLLLIPPGATRVESKVKALPRMLLEIERVP